MVLYLIFFLDFGYMAKLNFFLNLFMLFFLFYNFFKEFYNDLF